MRLVTQGCLLLVLAGLGCRGGATKFAASIRPSIPVAAEIVRRDHSPSEPVEKESDREIALTAGEEAVVPPPVHDSFPGTTFSLQQTLSVSLSQNPDLNAQRHAENVGSAALGVAANYPFNPNVQVQVTPYQDAEVGGPGSTYHYVLLMQNIQLAHQQQFREEGAAHSLNSIRWNIHQAELQNVAQTERLFFMMLYQRGLLSVVESVHANNEQLLAALQKQLEAGQATGADVAIVRVDTRSTSQQLRLATATYQNSLRDLKRQLGMEPGLEVEFEGDLRALSWTPPSFLAGEMTGSTGEIVLPIDSDSQQAVIAGWAAGRPDVMAAQADIDSARAALFLANANRTPDLQVGPYYQRTADGTSFLGFRAQMDIPVVNSGRPLELQRCAEMNQRTATWQAVHRRAELEALAAWERYQLALREVRSVDTGDHAAPDELKNLETQFLAGEVDVVRIIQARTSIIQDQRSQLDLLNELAQAAANLTATTGIPVEELLDNRGTGVRR